MFIGCSFFFLYSAYVLCLLNFYFKYLKSFDFTLLLFHVCTHMHVHLLWYTCACSCYGVHEEVGSPVFWGLNSGHQVYAAGLYQLSLLPACFNVCRLKRNVCTCGWYALPHMLLEPRCLLSDSYSLESLSLTPEMTGFFCFVLFLARLVVFDPSRLYRTTSLNFEDLNSRPCVCTMSTVTHWTVSPAATLSFKNVFWHVSVF